MIRTALLGVLLCGGVMAASDFDQAQAARFARLALDCVHKEYPNKISHSMNSDADVKPPRELTPAFYGCYDWHSSVHGHWLLVRLVRRFPQAPFAAEARKALAQSLTPANIAQEVKYLDAEGRTAFERPYGLGWLLQLAAELKEWDDPQARQWSAALAPLEQDVVARLSAWLPKLDHPIRVGEHNNTAFAMSLMLDYARIAGNAEFVKLVEDRARHYYLRDRICPVTYEPSGEDFLSPCLAEADLMRRVMPAGQFGMWFRAFIERLPFEPTTVPDVTDPKLYHLAGLNLSRAWMIEGILSKVTATDARGAAMADLATRLRQAGLDSITSEHYQGGHWLGTFAVYLVTGRGLK
ncbi:MAG TPA: DUF2891 domain-containing protein [Bryobacteraceae bacterium]|nr:DUF2891 domain-containing protein [Bryobacteraceae bacterium]